MWDGEAMDGTDGQLRRVVLVSSVFVVGVFLGALVTFIVLQGQIRAREQQILEEKRQVEQSLSSAQAENDQLQQSLQFYTSAGDGSGREKIGRHLAVLDAIHTMFFSPTGFSQTTVSTIDQTISSVEDTQISRDWQEAKGGIDLTNHSWTGNRLYELVTALTSGIRKVLPSPLPVQPVAPVPASPTAVITPLPPPPKQAPQVAEPAPVLPAPASTSGWKVYRSDRYGLELSYPARYSPQVRLDADLDMGSNRTTLIQFSAGNLDFINVEIYEAGEDQFRPLGDEFHVRLKRTSATQLGGLPAELREAEQYKVWNANQKQYVVLDPPCPIVQVNAQRGARWYSLYGSCGAGDNGKYTGVGKPMYQRDEFDRMVSSFRFTGTN